MSRAISVPANPAIPAHRTRATRLRSAKTAGQVLDPADELWLTDYTDRQKGKAGKGKNFGASQSKRSVKFELNEEAQAVGTGTAAEAAASALVAREEGRRLDNLTVNAMNVLHEAVATYKDMCVVLIERMKVSEATHITMLETVRDQVLARTNLEAEMITTLRELDEARAAPPQGNDVNGLLQMLVMRHLGVDPATVAATAAADANANAKGNGKPKS